jgi:hypothetical protein
LPSVSDSMHFQSTPKASWLLHSKTPRESARATAQLKTCCAMEAAVLVQALRLPLRLPRPFDAKGRLGRTVRDTQAPPARLGTWVSFPLKGGTDREGSPSTTARPTSSTRTLPSPTGTLSDLGRSAKAGAVAASMSSNGPSAVVCAAS